MDTWQKGKTFESPPVRNLSFSETAASHEETPPLTRRFKFTTTHGFCMVANCDHCQLDAEITEILLSFRSKSRLERDAVHSTSSAVHDSEEAMTPLMRHVTSKWTFGYCTVLDCENCKLDYDMRQLLIALRNTPLFWQDVMATGIPIPKPIGHERSVKPTNFLQESTKDINPLFKPSSLNSWMEMDQHSLSVKYEGLCKIAWCVICENMREYQISSLLSACGDLRNPTELDPAPISPTTQELTSGDEASSDEDNDSLKNVF